MMRISKIQQNDCVKSARPKGKIQFSELPQKVPAKGGTTQYGAGGICPKTNLSQQYGVLSADFSPIHAGNDTRRHSATHLA